MHVSSFLAPFLSHAKNLTLRALPILRPMIEERKRTFAELREGWNDKPVSGVFKRASEQRTVVIPRLLIDAMEN